MEIFKPIKEGKVREIYDNGESLIMVATDRISAFDHILKNKITDKGVILTQMSKFWFGLTEDIVPNHMISVDNKDMPEFFQQKRYIGNSTMCRKLTMLPVECIVRGYITGSGWLSYKEDGTVCGIKLPEGLLEDAQGTVVAIPGLGDLLDLHAGAALVEMFDVLLRVLELLVVLLLHPMGHPRQVAVLEVCGHAQVDVGGIEFSLDLVVDRGRHLLGNHRVIFLLSRVRANCSIRVRRPWGVRRRRSRPWAPHPA